MLSCQTVSGNTELLPAEQARLWKLFLLKPLTFEPMRDSEDFYGGAWFEPAPPPDDDTEDPPADDSGETPGDDSGDNSEETPGDNSGDDDSGGTPVDDSGETPADNDTSVKTPEDISGNSNSGANSPINE